jgi:hypothetical protein
MAGEKELLSLSHVRMNPTGCTVQSVLLSIAQSIDPDIIRHREW